MYEQKTKKAIGTFAELNKPDESLSKKVVKGGFWVFTLRGFSQLFGIARLMILARILAPSDFGLMGTALLVMATLEAFSQTGFQAALVQKKKDIEEYLNTAWTALILRGIILFAILCLVAPYAAIYFHEPAAKRIIQVSGSSILLQAFANIGIIYFYKELDFKKQFIYESSGIFADFLIAVSLAFILKSVWALVFGSLAGNVVSCIVSYIINPYKPRLSLELGKTGELFGYGKWVLGSMILIYIGACIDKISVGRLLGVAALGFYGMAYQISNVPATEITNTIGRVAFPAYSKIQDHRARLQQVYFQIARLTIAISIPIAIGIVFLAPDFTRIFLGEKWLPMVPAMQLLAGAGLIKSIISTGSPLFAGSGYPHFEFYMQLIRGLITIIGIYPLTIYMGIPGAALCVILSVVGMLIIWYPFSQNITKASWDKYANILGPPLFSSLFMAGSIYLSRLYWNPIQQPPILAVSVFIGISIISILVYVAVMYILQLCCRNFDIVGDVRLVYKSLIVK
jgi:lipopolysaccharide exporter